MFPHREHDDTSETPIFHKTPPPTKKKIQAGLPISSDKGS